jgi:hypothetical protein
MLDRRTITVMVLAMSVGGLLALGDPAGALVGHTHSRTHHPHLHASSQPALDAGRGQRRPTSQNWAGYVAQGGKFTSIRGSWTVPAVDCTSTPTGVVAMWVGIDGAGSHTVEQTGTFSACEHGAPSYAAWYEAFPASSTIIANPVGPGDTMTATVTNTGPQTFNLVLTDNTRGWTSSNPIKVRGRLVSAEAIAEAPSVLGQIVPLANFGSVAFHDVTVNGGPFTTAGAQPVTMATLSGVVKASPGPLSGGSFEVNWRHA